MNNEDPTKALPSVPDTEPTIFTIMERLKGMQELADQRQELADQRHETTLTLVKSIQEGMNEGFMRVREDISGLRQGQQELLQRVDELESKTS
jgi:hypothetical protein